VPNRHDWARIVVEGGRKADGEKWAHLVSGGMGKKITRHEGGSIKAEL
jgi:hypothetical protein